MIQGWGSEQFPKYKVFYKVKGLGHAPGDFLLSVMNVSHHKKHEYIYDFRVGI